MAFGPIMRIELQPLRVELAPLTKELMGECVKPGLQQASVTKYFKHSMTVPVLEDEIEWFEKTRTEKDSVVWGIFVMEGNDRLFIGITSLNHIRREHFTRSTSGSMIFRKDYWGKGIASAIHKARTWYAFYHLGHDCIRSAVVQGNIASLKALQKSGYGVVAMERNVAFVDGESRHQDNLECLNPDQYSWQRWWANEEPPEGALAARQKTLEAMEWAKEHVELL